jgi:hypothetical protein
VTLVNASGANYSTEIHIDPPVTRATDYDVEVTIAGMTDGACAGIDARNSPDGLAYYDFTVCADGALGITRFTAAGSADLGDAHTPSPLTGQQSMRLKVSLRGSTLQMFLNGELVLSGIDSRDATLKSSANVGLFLYNGGKSTSSATFSDFVYTVAS